MREKTFPPEEALALHKQLLTLDSHIDIPKSFDENLFLPRQDRQIDFAQMHKGSLSAACLVAYVPQGKRDKAAYQKAHDQAIEILNKIQHKKGHSGEINVEVTTTPQDVRRVHIEGGHALIPVIENGYVMGEDVDNIKKFRELGVCYMTLTHNGHNALADSSVPRPALGDDIYYNNGLSDLGKETISMMNKCGIVVDVSHASRRSMMQATEISQTPVIASHSCVSRLCEHRRNLDDAQLDHLARRGGVIQITAMSDFLRKGGDQPNNPVTIEDLVDHIDYVVRRIGPEYVGISSDFEGGGGVQGWDNVAQSFNLTQELLRRGYDKSEIKGFWGDNILRVFQQAQDYADASIT